jgi:hypothetical protein
MRLVLLCSFSILLAGSVNASELDDFSVRDRINGLDAAWAMACVQMEEEAVTPCMKQTNLATKMMHDVLDDADWHPSLKMLFMSAVKVCHGEIYEFGKRLGLAYPVVVATCITDKYSGVIETKGGLLKFLEWAESISKEKEIQI